jgi:hypothetical protein
LLDLALYLAACAAFFTGHFWTGLAFLTLGTLASGVSIVLTWERG